MPGVPPSSFAYLGPPGTFTQQALQRLPAANPATSVPMRSIPEAFDAVRTHDADAALAPIENSVEGSVGVTLDSLVTGDPLTITAEVVLPITFVLAGRANENVTAISSHPHALAQCRNFLRTNYPNTDTVEALSTAAAAADVAQGRADACICAPLAAQQHGLDVLADNIGDNRNAVTRFVLVTRPCPPPPQSIHDVTSLAVYIAHDEVGALLNVLTQLSVRGVNLTRIESRPTGQQLGRYVFFLDCTGHITDSRLSEALAGLKRVCADVRFLGSYRRDSDEPAVPPPSGLSDMEFSNAAHWLRSLRESGQ